MDDRSAVIPLRASRSGRSTMLLRLPRSTGLLVDGLTEPPESLLLGLGATSTLELRAVAAQDDTPVAVAAVLERLATAAERATALPARLGHVVLTGGGTLADGLLPLLGAYAHRVTPPEHAIAASAPGAARVDLVVAVTSEGLDLERCATWNARAAPVLPVIVRGDLVVIGPVLGAQDSPCARCIEMPRIDRDPRRSELLTAPDPGLHDPDQLDLDPAQAALAVGLVATLVRGLSQGLPIPAALSLTTRMSYPQIGHHAWTPHPRCRCTRGLG